MNSKRVARNVAFFDLSVAANCKIENIYVALQQFVVEKDECGYLAFLLLGKALLTIARDIF